MIKDGLANVLGQNPRKLEVSKRDIPALHNYKWDPGVWSGPQKMPGEAVGIVLASGSGN